MLFALRLRLRDMQRSIGSTGFLHGSVVSFLIESREAQTRKTASISHAHPSSSSKNKLSAFFGTVAVCLGSGENTMHVL